VRKMFDNMYVRNKVIKIIDTNFYDRYIRITKIYYVSYLTIT